MSKTYKKIQGNSETEANFELDLAPMLALMVCLIPIMLLSTEFVRVTVINTPLPQVVQKALEEDRNKKERTYSISVTMEESKDMKLIVKSDGRVVSNKRFAPVDKGWNFSGLRQDLLQFKQAHPKVFRLDLLPSEKVPYEEIVKFMDEVRTTKDGEPKLIVIDDETKEKAETELMFPDVIFGNVLEG